MEPPTKRRRHDSSARQDAQDEDDDDELASHPQEIRMRRDPDIQLALKRANADHKLQATMAHIIEKYSRDFEGIGDEIDMATGDIVVNNGHLHSMRDEGDVEGLWIEGDSNIDEDEGILLEDLIDEYSDGEELVKEIRDSQSDHENSQEPSTAQQDTPINVKDRGEGTDIATQSDLNMVNGFPHNPNARLSSDPHHDHNRFGHPPYGPDTSLGLGPPPGFGPWGMMPGFSMQAWGRDDIPPYFNMPPSIPGPWFIGGRYDFPANNGQTSIWSRNWAKKTKRAGSMKGLTRQALDKQPGDTSAKEQFTAMDDDRKSMSKEPQPVSQEVPASDRTINACDDDDGLIFSSATDPASLPESGLSPSPSEVSASKENTQRHPEKALQDTGGNVIKVPSQNDEDGSGRRRSGRARKQTEYMGKISWDDAKELRKTAQTLSVELYRSDPVIRKEFQSVDNTDVEGVSLLEKSQINLPPTKEPEMEMISRQVIPDSQDTATPFNSSTPRPSQSQEISNTPHTFSHPFVPRMELSDDEAPLVLSRIRRTKCRAGTPSPAPLSPDIPTQVRNGSGEHMVVVASSPPKINNRVAPRIETEVVGVLSQAVESLKRKRGRPKGSTRRAGGETLFPAITVATNSRPAPQKRKVGRPRKSDVSNPIVEAEVKEHYLEVTHSHDPPDHGEVTQQEQVHEALESEVPQASRHMSHELKWLLKTKPRSPTSNKQVRPRRSWEKLRQPGDTMEEPIEIIEKTPAAPEGQPVSRKSQEPLQETRAVMQETMETPETAINIQDEQPFEAGLTSPADGTGPPDYSAPRSPRSDEESHLDSVADYESLDNEPVQDDEPLPILPKDSMVQGASTPRKPKATRAPLTEPASSSHKPHTPRHTAIRTTCAPSSRRSLLSFISDSESDTDGSRDELARRVKSASRAASARPSTKKVWRSTALTREVHRTPSRRRIHEMSSPISTVKTPGGTIRMCGEDEYQCGRDFCFTCI
ncbi:hypothetical protein F53441_11405 [Fusarium austroafricanum]|uniref:Uncharacterized protein n=1 Tax=Fusarium austroafricanum TaxID=2364996 RepID=A0A8H4NQ64_9HYPO|nr:hypothetical protein F53441_11405 [Fusarium austroafricanum]